MPRVGVCLSALLLALCVPIPAAGSESCTPVSCPSGQFCFMGSCVTLNVHARSSHPRPHPHHAAAGALTAPLRPELLLLLSAAALLVQRRVEWVF